MYSCLVARYHDESEYQMFTYGGRSLEVPFRGISRTLETGQRFGVRSTAQGIRMIFAGDPKRVMAVDMRTAKKIAKSIKER